MTRSNYLRTKPDQRSMPLMQRAHRRDKHTAVVFLQLVIRVNHNHGFKRIAPPLPRLAGLNVHAVITTHTTRHLRITLLGVAQQTCAASTIVVACDHAKPDVQNLVSACADEFNVPILFVSRVFAGVARRAQTRNNGIRALQKTQRLSPSDLLIFLDGDTVPGKNTFDSYKLASETGDLIIGGRYNLDQAQTMVFETQFRSGTVTPTPDQLDDVRKRDSRARRQLRLRNLGFGKPHKPKLLSCNFAVRAEHYLAVNGHDENYEGWGQEDDDLGRRLYALGARPVVGIRDIAAYHQWHESAAPSRWEECPNVPRLESPMPIRCIVGLDNPKPQAELNITQIEHRSLP